MLRQLFDGEQPRPPRKDLRYIFAVDLGQAVDPTGIIVAEVQRRRGAQIQLGYFERILGMPYPELVAHVGRLMGHPEMWQPELVIDHTGVGRPVADMFRVQGLHPICVNITAGNEESGEGWWWSVSKLQLISRLQATLHSDRLQIQSDAIDAHALVSELQAFQGYPQDSGRWKFGARAGEHDDLVLACALAVWQAERGDRFRPLILDRDTLAQAAAMPRDRFTPHQLGIGRRRRFG